jgi:hypothetical protein
VTVRDMLLNKGYVLNINLDHTIGLNQDHSELYWSQRLPRPFKFLFPTADEPNTILESAPPRSVQPPQHLRGTGTNQ